MIVLIIVTIVLIALAITSDYADKEGWLVFSIIGLVVWALFGWGFYGCGSTKSTKEEPAIVTEVLRGKHLIVVSTICDDTKENTTIFKDGEVDYINEKTYFYWYVEYNQYNYETVRRLKFKNK